MDPAPYHPSDSTMPITDLSRSSSTKRKRSGKSTLSVPQLFPGRLIYSCTDSSSSSPSLSTSDAAECPEFNQLDGASQSDPAIHGAICEVLMEGSPVRAPTSKSTSDTTWTFLSNPALRLLPKWPGLYQQLPRRPYAQPKVITPPPTPPPAAMSKRPELQLISLFDIPPIAASLASNLYGHDLLNLRRLNSDFNSLLSIEISREGTRPYFHTLLLKSLLCPRADTTSDPTGVPCSSAGGNVGPCVACGRVICQTCVAPEIWTNRRYRYLCPSASCSGPITPEDSYCTCQSNLWVCRTCHTSRWLADLQYSSGNWLTTLPPSSPSSAAVCAATCALCPAAHTHSSDPRLPIVTPKMKREVFKRWMMAKDASSVSHSVNQTRKQRQKKPMRKEDALEKDVQRMRPVACAWCSKRIDPDKEDWGLRPEKIRIGEEKGRRWIAELEEKRRREREGAEREAAMAAAQALGRGFAPMSARSSTSSVGSRSTASNAGGGGGGSSNTSSAAGQ